MSILNHLLLTLLLASGLTLLVFCLCDFALFVIAARQAHKTNRVAEWLQQPGRFRIGSGFRLYKVFRKPMKTKRQLTEIEQQFEKEAGRSVLGYDALRAQLASAEARVRELEESANFTAANTTHLVDDRARLQARLAALTEAVLRLPYITPEDLSRNAVPTMELAGLIRDARLVATQPPSVEK